jgi:hypothetical protein
MSAITRLLLVGLLGAGLAVATTAQAGDQLFEGSWTVKAFGNECAASKVGTSGGVTKYPFCQLATMGTAARSGESQFYSIFGMPQGIQCNPNQPRCNFSQTPTDGAGNFAPLGGSQMVALFCGTFTGPRPAKGATATTGGKNKRPIAPLYRNPAFFTSMGAPGMTTCTATSTDGLGGKGRVQLGNPITGMGTAVTAGTGMGGFSFPAAASGSGPGLRATGVVGEFGALYPYVYSYTYVTMRNAGGFFGPGSGLGDAFLKLPRQGGGAPNAHIDIKAGAQKFGGVMRMLGALTTKVCYYRAGGCSLGENDWLYDPVGTTGSYTAKGVITKGYQALGTAVYFNSGIGAFSSVMLVGSRFGWTTGDVTVTAVGRGPHKTVHYAQGYDNRTTSSMGGQKGTIQLVTPILTQWLQPAVKFETGGIGILKLKFVPEPHTWMMLAAGVSLLGVGFRMRGR